MPKKVPKNAFYFFMMDFKEEQRKNGIHYVNLKETADAAGPEWTNAHPAARTKYQEMAKDHKMKTSGSEHKFTSTGISLAEIERQAREKQEAIEFERQDINNIVKLKAFNNSILKEDFYIMDVNSFCDMGSEFFIGEFTILKFNLKDGIKDNYHELINPGYTPIGYGYDVKFGCDELGLNYPDEDLPKSNYIQILANIIDYLNQDNQDTKSLLPPLFTLVEKVNQVQSFINQLCAKAAEDYTLFRVYRLDTLFYTLINTIKTQSNEGLPKESLANSLLVKDVFKYNPGLGCDHHEAGEKCTECTLARAKRWVFTILDRCCPVAGIAVVAGKHLPAEYDVEGIIAYKQEKMTKAGPSVASSELSSCNSSILNDTFNDSSVGNSSYTSMESRKVKRKHTPLRMPRDDQFYKFAPAKAPELTESEFPSLSSSRGRGRGRSVSSSLSSLKIED